jgi:pimeloyl-ACP methyl ester carboxylesterase
VREATMTLPDGRALAYSDLGAPRGPVVTYSHGAPGSRLDLVIFDDALAAADVRVIAADRPGYGRSSPQPQRRREDWPGDLADLADHLEIERFAVLGLSTGGQYALACAASLRHRVVAAGIVGGDTDFAWPDAWNDFPETEGTLMRIGDVSEAVAWCEARYGRDGGRFLEGGMGEMPPADQAVLEDEAFTSSLMATVGEAFRQGVEGYAQDMVIQGQPWSFDPGSITTPVWIYHGEVDTLTPVGHGRHTASLIPRCHIEIWPDEGHLSVIRRIPQLANDLVASLR